MNTDGMMTWLRQRITPEMLSWINDRIIGRGDGRKPRTYRENARKAYNAFSKSRKKAKKAIRRMTRKLLGYLKRDFENTLCISHKHPGCLSNALPDKKQERLVAILLLYQQQGESKMRMLSLEPRSK